MPTMYLQATQRKLLTMENFARVALLGFMEQEVCRQATVFIGTEASSMTQLVLLLRTSADGTDEIGRRTMVLCKTFGTPTGCRPHKQYLK